MTDLRHIAAHGVIVALFALAAAPLHAQPTYAVDAMVGQVNGEAIYADEVLEPIDRQLTALADDLDRRAFLQRATQLVAGRLRQIVSDALILGEAQRSLNENQRRQLRAIMQREREKALREYGRGALAVAERRLREEKGLSLSQYLEERRQEIIVQQFLRAQLMPRINVSRKDIERYYREHEDRYNPPPTRDIRVYISDSRRAAAELRQALDHGEASVRPMLDDPDGGIREMVMDDAAGDEVFADAAVNDALLGLDAGGVSVPVEVGEQYWVLHVRDVDQPRRRSLRDVQLDIDRLLKGQQFQVRVEQYKRELFETGSYNPLDEMAQAVMEVVVGRYAPPPAPGSESAPASEPNPASDAVTGPGATPGREHGDEADADDRR